MEWSEQLGNCVYVPFAKANAAGNAHAVGFGASVGSCDNDVLGSEHEAARPALRAVDGDLHSVDPVEPRAAAGILHHPGKPLLSQDPDATLRFHRASALTDSDIAAVEATTRARVPRLFEREGLLSGEAAEQMRAWDHSGGFSLDASVSARDRAGLERLLRYCARPPLAGGRLIWNHDSGDEPPADPIPQVRYLLPKPDRDGRTVIELSPFELLDRLAVLIPVPVPSTATAIMVSSRPTAPFAPR